MKFILNSDYYNNKYIFNDKTIIKIKKVYSLQDEDLETFYDDDIYELIKNNFGKNKLYIDYDYASSNKYDLDIYTIYSHKLIDDDLDFICI